MPADDNGMAACTQKDREKNGGEKAILRAQVIFLYCLCRLLVAGGRT